MADSIEDLFVVLTGDPAPLLAAFAQATAGGEAMAASITASMAEVKAAMAESLAGVGAGADSAGIAAIGTEAAAAAAQVTAATGEMDTALAGVGESAVAMGGEFDSVLAGMKAQIASFDASLAAAGEETAAMSARMAADNTAMAASADKAAASSVAVGDAMAGTSAKASEANTTLGMSNKALLGVGAAAIGAAYESVKMAGDFQAAVSRLNTSAGEAKGNLQMVSDGILAMAGNVGYSSDQLVTAMYKVESGGQHGADGLKVLQAAAEGAKTENADLTTVADALTSAMTDYHEPADQAATVTSKLVAATSQGKMTFQELAGSMAAILPVASANHVSLNDILGDLASMTMHGMSAEQASQNLADALRHMAAPTQAQSKELAALGMNATEVSKQLGSVGLSGTINEISQRIQSQMGPDGMVVVNLTNALKGMAPPVQELGQKVLDGSMSMKDFTAAAKQMGVINDKNVTSFAALAGSMHGIGTEAKSGSEIYQTYSGALRQAMGDATGMNVALMIGGENATNTANAIKAVSGATAEAGNHVLGFEESQSNLNVKLADAKAAVGSLVTSIGLGLIPILTPLVALLGTTAQFMAQHKTVATVLATALGVTLVGALLALTYAATKWAATSVKAMATDLASATTWLARKLGIMSAATTATEAEAAAEVTAETTGGARRLAAAIASGAVWLATKTAQGASAVAAATVSAASSSAAWVASNARILASQVADGAVWLTTTIAQYTAAAASAVAEAAVAAAAWVAANAALILATGGIVLAIGAVIAIGYELIKHWNDVKRIAGEVWQAIVTAWNNIVSQVGGLINTFIGWFSNAASWLVNAGYNIVVGLWNGIASGWSWLEGKVSSLASSLLSTAKSALGISSPSRLFADEVGTPIVSGLAQGIDQSTRLAVTAARSLAAQVTHAAQLGDTTTTGMGGGGLLSSPAGGGFLPPVSAPAGNSVVVHLHVAGSVLSEHDLIATVQKGLLRYGVRNPNSGTNYATSFA